MKNKTLATLIIINTMIWVIVAVEFANAGDLELSISQDYYTNPNMDTGNSLSIKWSPKESPVYYGGEARNTTELFGGQRIQNIALYSIFVGVQHKFKDITIHGQIGYVHPETSSVNSTFEAMDYYAATKLGPDHTKDHYANVGANYADIPYYWSNREYTMRDGIGGEIGINFIHRFSESFNLNIGFSYRILSLSRQMRWWSDEFMSRYPGQCWEWREDVDLGGPSIALGFTF